MTVFRVAAEAALALTVALLIVERAFYWSFHSNHVVVPMIIVLSCLALLGFVLQSLFS